MENASKALLIAAAILIVLVLIGISIAVVGIFSDNAEGIRKSGIGSTGV